MSDPGPQKGPASTARINAQTKAAAESMKGGALTVGVDWGKGDSLTVAALPAGLFDDYACTSAPPSQYPPITAESMRASLLKMVNQMKERFDNRDRIDFLCMTKATWELLKSTVKDGESRRVDLYGRVEGLPVEVFDTEFECVLHIRMRYAADGRNGLLVKGPEIAV